MTAQSPSPHAVPAQAWDAFRGPSARGSVTPIVRAYDDATVRAYCMLRFRIIRGRFLDEIAQFLPHEGNVVEVGCGFGLFGLYFARAFPELRFHCFDIDVDRVELARRAQTKLDLSNIEFDIADARTAVLPDGIDAAYMLDIVHHLEVAQARELLRRVYRSLRPGGVLVVKDVDTRPRYKMAFTWVLDVLMARERPHYWSTRDLTEYLQAIGFSVVRYAMIDALPYPHELYVCVKPLA